MKILSFSILVFFLAFIGCKKIFDGPSTTITGKLIDSITNEGIPNAIVDVSGCKPDPILGRGGCGNFIANITTDNLGVFKISLEPNSAYNAYSLGVNPTARYGFAYDVKIGKRNPEPITLKTRKFIPAKLNIRVNANLFTNAIVLNIFDTENISRALPGQNYDTVLNVNVIPNKVNELRFSVLNTNIGGYKKFITLHFFTNAANQIVTINLPNTNLFL